MVSHLGPWKEMHEKEADGIPSYTGFSPLQQARVLNMWHVFRSGN